MIGVGVIFSCSHRDPVRDELHGHTYEAVAWFASTPPRDAVVLQVKLAEIVRSMLDHKTLPDEVSRAEHIRAMLLPMFGDAIDIEINRPLERIYCRGDR
jgi:hypothetical protein